MQQIYFTARKAVDKRDYTYSMNAVYLLFLRKRQQRIASKGSLYSITERKYKVPELIPVLGSQPAGDVSHKPGGRLPLLSARPAVPPRNP